MIIVRQLGQINAIIFLNIRSYQFLITVYYIPTNASIVVFCVAGIAVTPVVALKVDTCAVIRAVEQGGILAFVNIWRKKKSLQVITFTVMLGRGSSSSSTAKPKMFNEEWDMMFA